MAKIKYLIAFYFLIINFSALAQKTIKLGWNGSKFILTDPRNEDELKSIDPRDQIKVTIAPVPPAVSTCPAPSGALYISSRSIPLTITNNEFEIQSLTDTEFNTLRTLPNNGYTISINCGGVANSLSDFEIGTSLLEEPAITGIPSNIFKTTTQKNGRNQSISQIFNSSKTYSNNQVHLFFDENGRSLRNIPVNVDQQDVFHIYMSVKKSEAAQYSLEVISGDYDQTDLAIRPSANLTQGLYIAQSKGGTEEEYVIIEFEYGPFTTQFFQFQFKKQGTTESTPFGPTHKIRINKIFHLGVGVSFIRTQLPDLKYAIAHLPNSTNNTIVELNDSPRPMVTFNVIWYWSVFQNREASNITRGRDVLKDEEAFTMKRVFPTFGVSLGGDFRENFFGGFLYEFARGGSLIAGGHYGKQRVLADENFKLGESVFTSTNNSDIILTDKFGLDFFIGLNLDTRIVNTLFGRGK